LVVWPPDDIIEQGVVVTHLHQTNIINTRWGINEVARAQTPPGGVAPWQALGQTVVTGFARPDGSRYKTLPDVFVYPHPIDPTRGSVAVGLDGPPILIVEVLSESTYDVDLDLAAGKGYSYARAGVREYLTLDPTRAFVPAGGRAWRLADGAYQPWEPDEQGRWQSAEIAVAIGLEGAMATVYRRDGRRLLREGEVEEELGRRDETIARQAAEIEELRRRLREGQGGD